MGKRQSQELLKFVFVGDRNDLSARKSGGGGRGEGEGGRGEGGGGRTSMEKDGIAPGKFFHP